MNIKIQYPADEPTEEEYRAYRLETGEEEEEFTDDKYIDYIRSNDEIEFKSFCFDLQEFLKLLPDYIRVDGGAIDWRGYHGYFNFDNREHDVEKFINKMCGGGDATIRIEYEEENPLDTVSIMRATHDVPMGGHFTISKSSYCCYCDNFDVEMTNDPAWLDEQICADCVEQYK